MSDEFIGGAVAGGVTGAAVAGVPGALVGGAIGGLLAEAYANKPQVGNFATTLQNDLAPENVTLDAHQIYVRITGGHGSSTLSNAHGAAKNLSRLFSERANQIAQARGAAAAAWQGEASTAAAAATTPLADSFAVAQQQLAANAQALDTEVAAFEHIRSQVEPVPATPPQSSLANSVNPFQSDADAAINAYNAKAAKNIALYEAYVADTTAARGQVPKSYAQPAPLMASASAVGRTASPIGSASVPPPQVGPGGASESAATGASGAGGGSPVPPPSVAGGGASGASSASGASGASAGGAPAGGSGSGPDSAGRPTPSLTSPSSTPGGVPFVPPPGTSYTSAQLPGQRRPGSADARKFTGVGPGMGGPGGGAVFGGGAGAGGAIAGGPSAGNAPRGGPAVTSGPVPNQTVPGQQGGRGAPVVRGPVGPAGTGMPMSPAGRAGGEDDQEHRRKYRVEPDGKELFGLDEPYVSPVIGDNR